MSGIATAIIGGAVISGVVAKGAADQAAGSAQTELDFAKAQYQDWKDIYGPIEDSLAEYYSGLSPDVYAAQGIQFAEEEYAKAQERQLQTFAQRGLDQSGITAAVEQQNSLDLARTKATIRQDAPQAVAEQKLSFLSVGQGNNPTGSYQQALGRETDRTRADSAAANAAFANSLSSAVNYGLGQTNAPTTNPNMTGLAGAPRIDYNVGVV